MDHLFSTLVDFVVNSKFIGTWQLKSCSKLLVHHSSVIRCCPAARERGFDKNCSTPAMGNPFLHNRVIRALCPKTYNLIRLQNHIMWSAPAVEADQASSCKGYRRVFPWKHSVVVKCTLWSAPSLKTFCAKMQRQTQILQYITIQIFCSHLISSRIHP